MERNDRRGRLKQLWSRWKYAALVAALGVALLLLPTGGGRQTELPAAGEAAWDLTETEGRMEAILSRISGVGELHLMLTAEAGEERRLAQDTALAYQGDPAAPEEYQRTTETVLSGGSEDAPVVTQTRCPVWRGALVVCQGGDDAQVKLAVTQAVAALTGLGSDRISVIKCQ